MKTSIRPFTVAALAVLFFGCDSAPVAVSLDRLSFPVIIVTGTNTSNILPYRAEVVSNGEELGRMSQETYARINDTTQTDPPIVIDRSGAAYDMKDIKGEHGGLWMMANPTSRMPIHFTLFRRREAGLDAARAIIAKSKYLGPDIDEERTKLRAARILLAKSIAEISEIIDEIATDDAGPRPHPFEPKE